MLRLLEWIFLGHTHRWKTVREFPLVFTGEKGKVEDRGTRIHQQCETCGIVVKRDLI